MFSLTKQSGLALKLYKDNFRLSVLDSIRAIEERRVSCSNIGAGIPG